MERVDLTGSKGCICADEGPEEVPSSKPRRPSAADADPEEDTPGKAVAWYDNDGSQSFTERTRRESGVVWSRSVSDIAGDEDEDEPETLPRPGAGDEAAAPARKPPKRSASILAPHDFEPTYFYLPDYCDNCGGVIIGNGFQCRGACGFKIHRGLGKGTENCHADVLLTLCEKREGHEHSWDTGDLAKQIARNTHQAVKDTVVAATIDEQKDWGKFDRLAAWAEFVRENWQDDRVVVLVAQAELALTFVAYALGYLLVRALRVTRSHKASVYLDLAEFSGAIAALAFLAICALLLFAVEFAAGLGLRYSAWVHVFVDEMIHVKLVDIGVDVAASCREVRKAAKKLASGSALGAAVAGAHYLYVLNKIAL